MGARCHCACVWAPSQLGLRHWPPVLRDVLLLHEPGAWAARSPQELEGDEGLQERCLPLAEGSRREGRRVALACFGRRAHGALAGAGRLYRCERGRSLQGRHLPLLIVFRRHMTSSIEAFQAAVAIPQFSCLSIKPCASLVLFAHLVVQTISDVRHVSFCLKSASMTNAAATWCIAEHGSRNAFVLLALPRV